MIGLKVTELFKKVSVQIKLFSENKLIIRALGSDEGYVCANTDLLHLRRLHSALLHK